MPSRAKKVVGGGDSAAGAPRRGRRRVAVTHRAPRLDQATSEIARAATKEEALAAFERWRGRHAAVSGYLEPADILVDGMRGRFTLWYRIRVNLEHVPPRSVRLRNPRRGLRPVAAMR